MATKSKKRRPGLCFFLFFLSLSILLTAGILTPFALENEVAADYKDTASYRRLMGSLIGDAYDIARGKQEADTLLWGEDNVSFDIYDGATRENWSKNASGNGELLAADLLEQVGAGQYDHVVYINGIHMKERLFTFGSGVQEREYDSLWRSPYAASFSSGGLGAESPTIAIAVKARDQMLNYGPVYSEYYRWFRWMMVLSAAGAVAGLALLVLLGTLIAHRTLGAAHRAIASAMGRLWMEVKLLLSAAALGFGGWTLWATFSGELGPAPGIAVFLLCFWWCWLVLADLAVNGREFFRNNIPMSVVRFMRSLESPYEFLERMKTRLAVLIGVELILLVVFGVLILLGPVGWILDVGVLALGIFLLARFVLEYNRNMDEFSKVVDYTAGVRGGTVQGPLLLRGDFAGLGEDLSDIMSGVSRAVEEQVRSERMKVELVTNVSHDLKTPLTSIINYTDLLGQENLTPDFANDYVKIIGQKAGRLSHLVQDLFEISKANSGAIDLEPERIDVVALAEQTIAEMDERMNPSGVEIKAQLAPQRLFVWADGRKLHRVFENLLGNALKYSLAGTRVYIVVRQAEETAEISFKNVASYEMTFTAEDIVERFQRGDASRTGEGSGLGLAIAKSFVELSGGALSIELDGDLFKATVTLPLCPEEPAPRPEEPAPVLREDGDAPGDGIPEAEYLVAAGGVPSDEQAPPEPTDE